MSWCVVLPSSFTHCLYFDKCPMGLSKYGTTRRNIQWYHTPKHLLGYMYFLLVEFMISDLTSQGRTKTTSFCSNCSGEGLMLKMSAFKLQSLWWGVTLETSAFKLQLLW